MLAAIDLDDQSGFEANEIDNVCVDGLLPPERPSVYPTATQPTPQDAFGVCHALAQPACNLDRHRRGVSPSSSFG
jgi:hypothetical protein